MPLRTKALCRSLLAGGLGLLAQIALSWSLGATPAAAADAYFSPAGTDSAGYAIGVDCTSAAPCKTVTKALSFLAGNIAHGAGPNRNYSLAFDGGSGPFRLASTAILTSAHTVSSGYTTTFDVYNGTQAAWSGGLDTAGTWTSTTLPSGAPGCVSSYLAHLAPLTGANAKSYVGAAWINGHRVQETINPRSGNPWATVPGYAGNPDRGSSMFVGPSVQFNAGNPQVHVNDLSRIGLVGEPIVFATAVSGIVANHPYWILTKSGATGGGIITISLNPSGTPVSPLGTATVQIQDPVQSANSGDRSLPPGENVFPYNASVADFASAYNQTDVKGEVVNITPNLAPVSFVNGKGVVVLNSRMFTIKNMFPGSRLSRLEPLRRPRDRRLYRRTLHRSVDRPDLLHAADRSQGDLRQHQRHRTGDHSVIAGAIGQNLQRESGHRHGGRRRAGRRGRKSRLQAHSFRAYQHIGVHRRA